MMITGTLRPICCTELPAREARDTALQVAAGHGGLGQVRAECRGGRNDGKDGCHAPRPTLSSLESHTHHLGTPCISSLADSRSPAPTAPSKPATAAASLFLTWSSYPPPLRMPPGNVASRLTPRAGRAATCVTHGAGVPRPLSTLYEPCST